MCQPRRRVVSSLYNIRRLPQEIRNRGPTKHKRVVELTYLPCELNRGPILPAFSLLYVENYALLAALLAAFGSLFPSEKKQFADWAVFSVNRE